MYLNEVYDLVDKFFIIESTFSNLLTKGLLWEGAKSQPRFLKFADKIVQLILDDAETAALQQPSNREPTEEFLDRSRWEKFLKWNNATGFFGDNDLLGFGDSDEIPARHVVNYLKYCRPPSDPVDVGTWLLFGRVDRTKKILWPAHRLTYVLGNPTFWTFNAAKNPLDHRSGRNYRSNIGGSSGSYLIGGTRITDCSYLPVQLAKRLAVTEQRFELVRSVALYPSLKGNLSLRGVESYYANSAHKKTRESACIISDVPEEIKKDMYLPWFYECNKERYPTLEAKHDDRLD